MGGLDLFRVIDRSATSYVPDDGDVMADQTHNATPLPGAMSGAPHSPVTPATNDSGLAPSPGTPLQDVADNRALMWEMLALMSEINQGIKELNEKLNK